MQPLLCVALAVLCLCLWRIVQWQSHSSADSRVPRCPVPSTFERNNRANEKRGNSDVVRPCSPNDAYALIKRANALAGEQRVMWGSTVDWPAQRLTAFFALQEHYLGAISAKGESYNYTFCEIGFGPGFSAINFLTALTPDCRNFTAGARLLEYDLPPSRFVNFNVRAVPNRY